MFRKLETTCLTKRQHEALIRDEEESVRSLVRLLTFQASRGGGALVHGEPAHLAAMWVVVSQHEDAAYEFVKAAAMGLDFHLYDE